LRHSLTTPARSGYNLHLDPIDFVSLYQQRMAQVAPPATA